MRNVKGSPTRFNNEGSPNCLKSETKKNDFFRTNKLKNISKYLYRKLMLINDFKSLLGVKF